MKPALTGLLVIDKPGGITSRDALNRVQKWFPRGTRIGHTGTLDPLATGVLVACLGTATRFAEYVQDMSKEYLSTFTLGARSTTDDAEGEITPVPAVTAPTLDAIRAGLERFHGTIEQIPPQFSAAHIDGARAHDLARRGKTVPLQPRPVRIYSIDILDYEYPQLRVRVHCGKGTYIRALARDLGELLGCGAHVQSLRRTRVGPFCAEEAVPLTPEAPPGLGLLPLERAVAELPRLVLESEPFRRFQHGQKQAGFAEGAAGEVAVFSAAGILGGIGRIEGEKKVLVPVKVLG